MTQESYDRREDDFCVQDFYRIDRVKAMMRNNQLEAALEALEGWFAKAHGVKNPRDFENRILHHLYGEACYLRGRIKYLQGYLITALKHYREYFDYQYPEDISMEACLSMGDLYLKIALPEYLEELIHRHTGLINAFENMPFTNPGPLYHQRAQAHFRQLPLFMPPGAPPVDDANFEQAMGDYDRAIAAYAAYQEARPVVLQDLIKVFLERNEILKRFNYHRLALEDCSELLKQFPDYALYVERIELCLKLGGILEKELSSKSRDQRCLALQEIGKNYELAYEDCQKIKALEVKPEEWKSFLEHREPIIQEGRRKVRNQEAADLYDIGVSHLQKKNYEKAILFFDLLVTRYQKTAFFRRQGKFIYQGRGDAHFAQRNYSPAISDYTHALADAPILPKFAVVYYQRACASMQVSKKEDARYDYWEACTKYPEYIKWIEEDCDSPNFLALKAQALLEFSHTCLMLSTLPSGLSPAERDEYSQKAAELEARRLELEARISSSQVAQGPRVSAVTVISAAGPSREAAPAAISPGNHPQ